MMCFIGKRHPRKAEDPEYVLRTIDEKYKDKNINGLFNNLENITFYVLPLEDNINRFKLESENSLSHL